MTSTISVVHVQGAAVDPDYSYIGERQMAAYRKLAEICQQVGLSQTGNVQPWVRRHLIRSSHSG